MTQPILLIDDRFPRARSSGFSGRKHAEFTTLLELLPNAVSVCPPAAFTRLRDRTEFEQDKQTFLQANRQLRSTQVSYCDDLNKLTGALAYCVFPHYAYRLLPTLERNRIPFAFTIYPGGGFVMWGPLLEESEKRLRSLFASPYFRGVFVHHRIIDRYLQEQHGVGDKIFFQRGGFSQLDSNDVPVGTRFGFGRDHMAIGFVANRYDERGLGKGYDLFIAAAHRLAQLRQDCAFHVMGDWGPDILDVSSLGERIQFHGYLNPAQLMRIYADLDVIISPTRIDIPVVGKFDGFPLVVDAGMSGVAMFVSDPLGQNEDFVPGEDLEIVKPDADNIVERLLPYFQHPERLRDLARRGQTKIKELRAKEPKLRERAKILTSLTGNSG